jgi:LmbE family N-acetylglucosaminyl deacetylase
MNVQTPDDIKQLGTILGVWAHPDDETFCAGGIMAAAAQNGQTVACVTFTKGEAGIQDAERWPPEQLGKVRAQELAAAMTEIGINYCHPLDYPDGCCNQVNTEQPVQHIVELIEQYQPQTILTFGPDGLTGHPDHQTVSEWAGLAVKKSGHDITIYHVVQSSELYDLYLKSVDEKFNFFFNTDQPPLRPQSNCDICFTLPGEVLEQKYRALKAMPSQTEAMIQGTPHELLLAAFGVECFEEAN